MAWFKVDDRLPTSRKLIRIPRDKRTAAIGLWTIAGAWSAHDLTDGFVPDYMIEEWGGDDQQSSALVQAGMWEPSERDGDKGFQFINWAEYQPVKVDVEERRAADREKKRRQRRDGNGKFAGQNTAPEVSPRDTPGTSAGLPRDNGGTPQMSPGESTVPGPARPDPSRPGPAPKETPLPSDWAPTPEHEKKARELNVDLLREAETFRAHAEANDRRAKRWNAAFTQWLLKARPMPRGAAPLPIPGARLLEEWELRG